MRNPAQGSAGSARLTHTSHNGGEEQVTPLRGGSCYCRSYEENPAVVCTWREGRNEQAKAQRVGIVNRSQKLNARGRP